MEDMEEATTPRKTSFSEAYAASGFTWEDINLVASRAHVHPCVLNQLIFSAPVDRDSAARVLKVLAQKTHRKDWTLDTVDVTLEGDQA